MKRSRRALKLPPLYRDFFFKNSMRDIQFDESGKKSEFHQFYTLEEKKLMFCRFVIIF